MITRLLLGVVLQPRRLVNSEIKRFARKSRHRRVLEIGSGKATRRGYRYSAAKFFPDSAFTRSDIDPAYGHLVLDVRSDSLDGYDTLLCVSVLEHVYDWPAAVQNLTCVAPGTEVLVIVPAFYPLHDEPYDYWRFSEHALREMFKDFATCEVRHRGLIRQFPTIYSVSLVR